MKEYKYCKKRRITIRPSRQNLLCRSKSSNECNITRVCF